MKLIPLGPSIYQSYVTEEFFQFLTNEYKHIEKYERLFQNENQWNGKDYAFVNFENRKYVEDNLKSHVKEYVGTDSVELMNQWINVQAHDGFLPEHVHTGNLSYVIYLKLPDYLKNYYKKLPNDIKYVEGCIQFNFGHETSLSLAHIPIRPEEKMILMFPSEVYHYVYPFRDRESERVSISGNLKWKS